MKLDAIEIFQASILIVDDKASNVLLLESMLRNVGYQNISSTMDPRAVCALHAAHRYDLILLDLQMPEMDGFEVMEALKQLDPDTYLPVLVITAQPGHKLRALQAGAKDFVSKPFDLVEVQTRIHNMLEVRLLYKKLANYNKVLEQTVLERTAELLVSEARFKSFTELSSDWYWEQDAAGCFTQVSGPVQEMLGLDGAPTPDQPDMAAHEQLRANIAARRPFLDLVYSRLQQDGRTQYLQVSGEPMFDASSRFIGYRGIGMELDDRRRPDQAQLCFRSAMGLVEQGVLMLDAISLRVLDANETLCRMSGYQRDELLKLNPRQLLGTDAASASATLEHLQSGHPVTPHETQMPAKNGLLVTVSIDWHTLQINQQMILVAIFTGADAAAALALAVAVPTPPLASAVAATSSEKRHG